jgi:hypothetical protein
MVKIDLAAQALPSSHWNYCIKAGLFSRPGDSNTFTPVDFDRSVNECHRTSVTYVGSKDCKLEPIPIEKGMTLSLDQIAIHIHRTIFITPSP